MMNGVELTPSLWLIHLLESNKVAPPKFVNESEKEGDISNDDYIECMIESIKCHHNDIADYFETNLQIWIIQSLLL